nr:ribonuclease III [Desulfovibrio inopinatus]
MNEDTLETLQQSIHHAFSHINHLQTALTHSSYANENHGVAEHNERLEFLGDAVLELCVSQELYARFPDAPEGALTRMRSKLVNERSLAELARRLDLSEYVYLGKGEEVQGGRERPSLLSDVVEAIFGAIFLDAGFDAARHTILMLFKDKWPVTLAPPKAKDYKSRLQEYTQSHFKERPLYALARSFGPEHAKMFEVELRLPDGNTMTATGTSVKKAQQLVAKQALARYDPERAS